ncbi:FK506-binding protein 5-like [Diachasma alloeum]|uniref:FK506-binding protein 5-like n=1 Tax=Diachasma alloeum TaxID=454923 RepID=UPI0010FB5520|nr:FK506-binding protein 5-like [Diachasma alloeum]
MDMEEDNSENYNDGDVDEDDDIIEESPIVFKSKVLEPIGEDRNKNQKKEAKEEDSVLKDKTVLPEARQEFTDLKENILHDFAHDRSHDVQGYDDVVEESLLKEEAEKGASVLEEISDLPGTIPEVMDLEEDNSENYNDDDVDEDDDIIEESPIGFKSIVLEPIGEDRNKNQKKEAKEEDSVLKDKTVLPEARQEFTDLKENILHDFAHDRSHDKEEAEKGASVLEEISDLPGTIPEVMNLEEDNSENYNDGDVDENGDIIEESPIVFKSKVLEPIGEDRNKKQKKETKEEDSVLKDKTVLPETRRKFTDLKENILHDSAHDRSHDVEEYDDVVEESPIVFESKFSGPIANDRNTKQKEEAGKGASVLEEISDLPGTIPDVMHLEKDTFEDYDDDDSDGIEDGNIAKESPAFSKSRVLRAIGEEKNEKQGTYHLYFASVFMPPIKIREKIFSSTRSTHSSMT